MNDRTDEFEGQKAKLGMNEYEVTTITAMPYYLETLFKQVQGICDCIEVVKSHVDSVKRKQSDILSNPFKDVRTMQELDDLKVKIRKSSADIRNRLKVVEQSTQGKGDSKTIARMKKSQHFTLLSIFTDVMTEYNNTQTEYQEKCRAKIRRQIECTGRQVDERDLTTVTEKSQTERVAIFTQGIVTDLQAKLRLSQVQARHDDFVNLEANVRELRDLFVEMAAIMEHQGEMINQIEHNVEIAEEEAERGKENYAKALAYKRR